MMRVKDLIAKLYELNQDDSVVIIGSDSEGNSFSPIDDITIGHYTPETECSGYPVDEDFEPAIPAIFIYPIK